MKRFDSAVFIALSALAMPMFAQNSFSVVHALEANLQSSGRSVFQTEYGFLLFHVETEPEGERARVYATGFDAFGNILWVKTHSRSRDLDPGLVDCFTRDPGGEFTAAISSFASGTPDSLYLYHFSSEGDTLSTHFVGSEPSLGVRDCLRTAEGNYLVAGWCTVGSDPIDDCACLRMVDPMGQELWRRTWPEYRSFFTVAALESGHYLIGGNRFNASNVDETVLVKINNEGAEQWVRFIGGYSSYGGGAGHSILLSDGNYLVPGTWLPADSAAIDEQGFASLYCYSPAGELLWRKDLLYGRFGGATIGRRLANGDCFITGGKYQVPRDPDLAATIWRTDPIGDTLYSRKYWYYGGYAATNTASYGMDTTSDGGVIFTGLAKQSINGEFPLRRYSWLLKLDEYGCLTPGCQNVGVQDYELALQSALCISPNPASDHIQYTLALPEGYQLHGGVQALLLDAQGKEVARLAVQPSGSRLAGPLPVNGLAPGLYYLHLRDEVKWLAGGKVVVE